MSSRRSKLFNYLRVCFFVNLILTIFIFAFWFWQRSRLSDHKAAIATLSALNIKLSADLKLAHLTLTNQYFNFASSYTSNILVNVVSKKISISQGETLPNPLFSRPFEKPNETVSQDLPPVVFNSYFEVHGVPHIKVRNKIYQEGDLLLGYPVQLISPDVVQYRDKFFKVGGGVE